MIVLTADGKRLDTSTGKVLDDPVEILDVAEAPLAADDLRKGEGIPKPKLLFLGPRMGRWANAQHTIHYEDPAYRQAAASTPTAPTDAKPEGEVAAPAEEPAPEPEAEPKPKSGVEYSAEDVLAGKAPYKPGEAMSVRHDSPESAYLVGGYPYGFHDRTVMRVWVETNKQGQRYCAQTKNPKTGKWNAEKKSTYHDCIQMTMDADGHVGYTSASISYYPEKLKEFMEKYPNAIGKLPPLSQLKFKQALKYQELTAGGMNSQEALHASHKWAIEHGQKSGLWENLKAEGEKKKIEEKAAKKEKASALPTGPAPEIKGKYAGLILTPSEIADMPDVMAVAHHYQEKGLLESGGRWGILEAYNMLAKKAAEVNRSELSTQYKHAASMMRYMGAYGVPEKMMAAFSKLKASVEKHGSGTQEVLSEAEPEKTLKSEVYADLEEYLEKADKIPGGLAEGKPDSDFDEEKLRAGAKVEMEHTTDPAIAREIAKDHLTEDADYYEKLARMEKPKEKDKAMTKSFSNLSEFLESTTPDEPLSKSFCCPPCDSNDIDCFAGKFWSYKELKVKALELVKQCKQIEVELAKPTPEIKYKYEPSAERAKLWKKRDKVREQMAELELELADKELERAKIEAKMDKALPAAGVEGGRKTPPKEYREGGATEPKDYADPKNHKYPIDTEAHVRAALSYFSKPKNANVYSPAEQKSIMARIHGAAKRHGIEVSGEVEKGCGKDHELTPGKARKILHAKEVQGHPLSNQQRKFMGAVSSGETPNAEKGGGQVSEYDLKQSADKALEGFNASMPDGEPHLPQSEAAGGKLDKGGGGGSRSGFGPEADEAKKQYAIHQTIANSHKRAAGIHGKDKSSPASGEKKPEKSHQEYLNEYLKTKKMTREDVDKLSPGARNDFNIEMMDWKHGQTHPKEKSMAKSLEEFLVKSEGAGGLPEGEPTMGGSGEEQGASQDLAGEGKPAEIGSSDGSATHPAGASPAAEKDKLSEDEEEDEDNMREHKKPIETTKSMALPQNQRDMMAKAMAEKVSKIRKGEPDVTVGLGIQAQLTEPTPEENHLRVFNQGPDSVVGYSNAADQEIERMLKGDQFYATGESPAITAASPFRNDLVICQACNEQLSKSLSTCPHCGVQRQPAVLRGQEVRFSNKLPRLQRSVTPDVVLLPKK